MASNATNIRLGVVVSDYVAGIKQAQTATQSFTAAFNRQFGSLTAAAQGPEGAFSSLSRALLVTKAKIRDVLASGSQVPTELSQKFALLQGRLNSVNSAFQQTSQQINGGGLLSSLAGLGGGFLSVSTAIGAVKAGLSIISDFERLDAGLKAVSTSTLDFARSQQFLQGLSNQLGISYKTLADSYRGLKAASNGTTLEGKATEKIFSSVVRAGAALKLSTEDIEGALRALQQMMSKGKVSSEELRQQLGERLPGAFGAMAKALGVTTPQLNKMLEAGEVLAEDALPKLAIQLEKTYGAQSQANVNSMAGGTTRLLDQTKLLIAEFGKSAGIDTFFGKLTNGFADSLLGLRQLMKDGAWLELTKTLALAASNAINPLGRLIGNTTAVDFGADRAKATQRFVSLPTTERTTEITRLKKEVSTLTADLAKRTQNTLIDSPQVRAERRGLESKKQLLRELQRESLKLYVTERQSTEASTKAKVTGKFDPLAEAEKLKKQYEADIKVREASQRLGLRVSPAVVKRITEYEAITKRIEKINNPKEVRITPAKDTYLSRTEVVTKQVDLLKKQIIDETLAGDGIKDLSDRLVGLQGQADTLRLEGKIVPPSLLASIDLLTKKLTAIETKTNLYESLIEQTKRAAAVFERLELTGKISALQIRGGDKPQSRFVSANPQQPTLVNRLKLDTKGLVDTQGFDLDEKLASSVENNSRLVAALEAKKQSLRDFNTSMNQILAEGAATAFEGMGQVIGGLLSGTIGIDALPALLLSTLGSVLTQLGKMALAVGIGIEGINVALKSLNPVLAIAAGVGLIALGALVSNGAKSIGGGATPFADGGLVYGPTLGLVGEYAGARRNPEVISPLDKLQGFIREAVGDSSGGNSGPISLEIRGRSLRTINRRDSRDAKLYGRG